MKLSTLTMAFITIMIHILLLLTAYTLQENRTTASTPIGTNFLGATSYQYADAHETSGDEGRTMRVLIPSKYR